jgi:hypothetical protein
VPQQCTGRELLAFLLAPLVVPFLAVMLLPALGVLAWPFGIAAGYVGMIIFGIPTFLFLRRRKWASIWLAGGLGFVFGGIMWLVVFSLFVISLNEGIAAVRMVVTERWHDLWIGGLIGMPVGIIFWLIARPDRELSV